MTIGKVRVIARPGIAAPLCGLAALALWVSILAREWPRLRAIGVICGESAGLFGHCAACYPAAAMTALWIGGELFNARGKR